MRLASVTRVVVFIGALSLGATAYAQDPHAGHKQPTTKEQAKAQTAKPQPAGTEDHSAHMKAADSAADEQEPKEPIPPVTDADRAAAFPPDLAGHAVHDHAIVAMFLFDQLEWQGTDDNVANVDYRSWIGTDRNRLWIRSELESERSTVETAFVDVLYGRPIARWWDLVAGVRQDFQPGPGRTWVGGGVQGLAPYFFEVDATAYVGEDWRTHARFEVEYEMLLTNRLVLQPLVEAELYGKSDPDRGLGAGLSTLEGGLRLRYEFKREFAPYIGITWGRKMFGTADAARAEGQDVSATRFAVGLRTWF